MYVMENFEKKFNTPNEEKDTGDSNETPQEEVKSSFQETESQPEPETEVQTSLQELLGEDYEQRVFGESLEGVLSEVEQEGLENATEVRDNPEASETARRLQELTPEGVVKEMEIEGETKYVLIDTYDGEDLLYKFIDADLVNIIPREGEDRTAQYSIDKMVAHNPSTGATIDLGELVGADIFEGTAKSDRTGEEMRSINSAKITKNQIKINRVRTTNGLASFLHEVGHRARLEAGGSEEAVSCALGVVAGAITEKEAFARLGDEEATGELEREAEQAGKSPQAILEETFREINVEEERGASAFALRFMRKMQERKLHVGGSEGTRNARQYQQEALATYDLLEARHSLDPEAYSDQLRKARKEMRQLQDKFGVEPWHFDPETGEKITHRPDLQLKYLNQQLREKMMDEES